MRLLDSLPKLLKWWTVIFYLPKFEEAVEKFDSDVELDIILALTQLI